MNSHLSLANAPSILLPKPVPLPLHFRSNQTQRTEAIHVSDLIVDYQKSNSNSKTPPTFITTLLGLFSVLTNFTKNEEKIPNDRNQPKLIGMNQSKLFKIRNRYNCRYGYQGRYCDPCGVSFAMPMVKIVGGFEAIPHSWPSSAYIVFNYKADVFLQDQGVYYKLEEQMVCGGSLITRDTSK